MDGLALLCNLHADGPLSLRRLRGADVRSLDDLAALAETELAGTLRASASQVRRFQHEGKLLARRLREQPLESELVDEAPIPGDVRARLMKAVVRTPVAYDLDPPAHVLDSVGVPSAEQASQPVQPPAPAAQPEPQEAPVAFGAGTGVSTAPAEPAAQAEALEPAPPKTTALQSGELPGLDSRTCQRLVAQGVRTYDALVELANLNLARRTGIPFTRLLDLRHHARAYLERLPREAGAAGESRHGAESAVQHALRERTVQPQPATRPLSEPPRALRMERVPRETPMRIPVPKESPRPDEPGVAGPFV